jgi:hypothetical protein
LEVSILAKLGLVARVIASAFTRLCNRVDDLMENREDAGWRAACDCAGEREMNWYHGTDR